MAERLTAQAEEERAEFDRLYGTSGCSCHISPPCGCCTHPGNPINQEMDDSAWEEDEEPQLKSKTCTCPSLLFGHEIGCPYYKA